ncbi:putative deoxyribonuclease tatdn3-A-like protein [Piptocephalis cylindrospora]|uniref:Putative deoxyribonuclease tatdn3-A-like protein n=1 Tax=Piptocephalis cylindrospora TaxID=1907219 RepID=A0A4P9Y7L5_9FUNG|nr:putative deoxyribonuclease tatdn3-A-like protein [Piptocephalis cylindrospora]|eukprot:RKP15137.1 putative deoxyribonuclease tatdn3-A-like protein [Piptocephalis cylindrospora]
MFLIDCHAHLVPRSLPPKTSLAEHLQRLADRAPNLGAILTVTEDWEDIRWMERRELSARDTTLPLLLPLVGIHPVQPLPDGKVRSAVPGDLQGLEAVVRRMGNSLVGLGEVGLDFSPHILKAHQDQSADFCAIDEIKDDQRRVFRAQVLLSLSMGLTLNVHSRQAGHHALSLLREEGASPALMHAFDGRPAAVRQGLTDGHYFSIAPSILRDPGMERLARLVPLDRLILETDSPALGPVAGEANDPSNITVSLRQIARIKDVSVEEVARATTQNALRLFPRLGSFVKNHDQMQEMDDSYDRQD